MLKIQTEKAYSLFEWTPTHGEEFSSFTEDFREFLMLSEEGQLGALVGPLGC